MVVLAPSISGTFGWAGTGLTDLNGAGHGPGDDGPQGIRSLEHHRLGILLFRHGAARERGRGEGRSEVGGGKRALWCGSRAFGGQISGRESMAAMPDASSRNARAAGPSGRAVTKAEFELGGGSHLTVYALYLLLISARVCPFPSPTHACLLITAAQCLRLAAGASVRQHFRAPVPTAKDLEFLCPVIHSFLKVGPTPSQKKVTQ